MTYKEAEAKILMEHCNVCGSLLNGGCEKGNCEIYLAIKALEAIAPKKPCEEQEEVNDRERP